VAMRHGWLAAWAVVPVKSLSTVRLFRDEEWSAGFGRAGRAPLLFTSYVKRKDKENWPLKMRKDANANLKNINVHEVDVSSLVRGGSI